jgi:uncharacterized protein (TIGR03435 family)
MLAHLADVSVRSLALLIPAALILWLMRRTRSAALQHAVWTAVVCGMLALFAFGQTLPRLPLRIIETRAVQTTATATPATPLILDSLRAMPSPAAKPHPSLDWRAALLFAWASIACFFCMRFSTGMVLARRLFANAQPTHTRGVSESARVSVPVTVGWRRPRILLPLEWRTWDNEKLKAVLAHEGAHVRRRDGLISALAGINRSIFWFHPLAWILERKLALLADQACDETSVVLLGDRDSYARLLLEMAQIVDRSQGRLQRHALTMAAGSHIGKRIEAILDESRTFSQGLTRKTKTSLLVSAVVLVVIAGAVQPAPVAHAQTTLPTPVPKFDTVSVKPCEPGDGAGHAGRGGGTGGRGIPMSPPGELLVNCMTLWEMVGHAATESAPLLNDFGGPFEPKRVTGGPPWIYSEYYTINAKSSDPVANAPGQTGGANFKLLSGSMLLDVLEDNFHLKYRRVTQDVPVYSLHVAPGGFKLQPSTPGDCIPYQPGTFFSPGPKPYCMNHGGWNGPNWTIDGASQPLANMARMLSDMVMRPVLDKTSTTGLYTYNLKFAHDANAPGDFPAGMGPFANVPPDIPVAPTIATALEQQLGLTLVSGTGPRETIVIYSATRP